MKKRLISCILILGLFILECKTPDLIVNAADTEDSSSEIQDSGVSDDIKDEQPENVSEELENEDTEQKETEDITEKVSVEDNGIEQAQTEIQDAETENNTESEDSLNQQADLKENSWRYTNGVWTPPAGDGLYFLMMLGVLLMAIM